MPKAAPTRYDLYCACVQDAPATVRFLVAAHGGRPLVLRDDFAGPAGIAAAWVRSHPRRRATAVDLDPEPLAHAPTHPRLRTLVADATRTAVRADVIALFNFAACELHQRDALVAYLTRIRRSLNPRGVLALDIYGGTTAYTPGSLTTFARSPWGRVKYTWQQKHADASTGRVENHLHFELPAGGKGQRTWPSAFVYHWRLWSIPELRDALADAGFGGVEVYDRLGDALDHNGNARLRTTQSLEENFVAYLVARRDRAPVKSNRPRRQAGAGDRRTR